MYVILQERFRRRVREELAARGWSQSELARRMGVTFNSVNQYLRGTRAPGLDLVESFAVAFGYDDPMDLLNDPAVVEK